MVPALLLPAARSPGQEMMIKVIRTLKPERTKTLELGTELRFFNNRLGLDFSWYKLNSREQIIPVSVSPTIRIYKLYHQCG